jgi:hypothetical protein
MLRESDFVNFGQKIMLRESDFVNFGQKFGHLPHVRPLYNICSDVCTSAVGRIIHYCFRVTTVLIFCIVDSGVQIKRIVITFRLCTHVAYIVFLRNLFICS